MISRVIGAVALALMFLVQGASAQSVAPADQTAIHKVIQAQIDAIAKNDYNGAYALATPGIKALYSTAQSFQALIQTRYPQLIRPKSIVFGTLVTTPQGPIQRVFITASDSKPYVASYSLQQQPDNSWLIAGCTIARDNASSAI
jgi:hypothetical protein